MSRGKKSRSRQARRGFGKRILRNRLFHQSCHFETLEARTLLSAVLSTAPAAPLGPIAPSVVADQPVQPSTGPLCAPVAAVVNGPAVQAAANTIDITAAWLAQQGAAPYILSSSNTTYVLQTDVTVNGTAFVFGAKGITLDLNGHTVTYGNSAPISVTNGGFEAGNVGDTAVAGWDLTAAPGASLAAVGNTMLWGNNVLEFANISTAQTIKSNTITLPTANRQYTALVTPASPIATNAPGGNQGETITLAVYNASDNSLIGSTALANWLGYSVVLNFNPGSATSVYIKITADPSTTPADSCTTYIDDVELSPSRDYGIIASTNWGDLPTWMQTTSIKNAMIAMGGTGANAVIQNGTITQGQAGGYRSLPIYCQAVNGILIQNVTSASSGADTGAVDANWSSNVTVQNNVFNDTATLFTDRMTTSVCSIVNISRTPSNVLVQGNTINNAPCSAIVASQTNGLTISGNTISMAATVGNSFGVLLSYVSNFAVASNTVTGNGRGICLDGAGGLSTIHSSDNGTFHDNYVDVREHTEREYGTSGGGGAGLAFYMRTYDDRGWTNIDVYNNTFICRTGGVAAGDRSEAIGMRLVTSPSSYDFAVSGIAVLPTVGAVYSNNGNNYTVISADSSHLLLSGANTPSASGTLTKQSGTGDASITFGSWIPEANSTGADMGNVIENNTFKAIVETDDGNTHAIAFADDSLMPNTSPLIENNVFESNDTSLQVGWDYGGDTYDGDFVSNTCRRNTTEGDQSRTYKSVGIGYWISNIHNIQLIDMRYENGAPSTITWTANALPADGLDRDVSVGWLLNVTVESTSGAVLPDATVSIFDKNGAIVYSGMTDANGQIKDIPLLTTIYRQSHTNLTTINTDDSNPYQIEVSLAGYHQSPTQLATLTQSQDVLVQWINQPPSVATPAAATPSPVTGTTTALSVFGADDGGEANLTYTWTTLSKPNGAADPTYTLNDNNAAKDTTATFYQAGDYTFQVTIVNAGGLFVTSTVSVTVDQTLTSIVVSPTAAVLDENQSQQFSATAYDQFDDALDDQPAFAWSDVSGIGSINAAGLYTSASTAGTDTIVASSAAVSGSATITVNNAAPTLVTTPRATPSPVVATSTTLSVLGADDGGEANLTYTWRSFSKPTGAADPTYTLNGNNAAKNTVATFYKAGSYTFQVTIADAGGLSTTSTVVVAVNQTLTSIVVSPAAVTLNAKQTQQFAAIGYDQFNAAMSNQPAFTWSLVSGGGSISVAGLYTAPATSGLATISTSVGSVSSSATITVSGPVIANMVVLTSRGYMTWNAADSAGVASSSLTVDGRAVTKLYGPYKAAVGVDYCGMFGVLSSGTHSYTITATDKLGNSSQSTGTFSTQGQAGPAIGSVVVVAAQGLMTWNVLYPAGIGTTGLTVDGAVVKTIYGPIAATSGVNFAGVFGTLAAGPHGYTIIATDTQGNRSQYSGTFNVVAAGPSPTIGSVVVVAAQGLMTWNVQDPAGVKSTGLSVDGTAAKRIYGPYTASTGVNYAGIFGILLAGNHTYTITATDNLGHTSQLPGDFDIPLVPLSIDAAAKPSAAAASLTEPQLAPVVLEAERRLAAVVGTVAQTAMAGVRVQIADLPDGLLGEVVGKTVLIDRDAAGYGWFVDPTPADDAEFAVRLGGDALAARSGSPAADRVDLLTAVMHEMGHILGYGHDNSLDLMNPDLPPGERRLL